MYMYVRERSILQGKLKSLKTQTEQTPRTTTTLTEPNGGPHPHDHNHHHTATKEGSSHDNHDDHHGNRDHGDEVTTGDRGVWYAARRRVFELEGEVQRLQREMALGRDSELKEAQLMCQQLQESKDSLERQIKLQVHVPT